MSVVARDSGVNGSYTMALTGGDLPETVTGDFDGYVLTLTVKDQENNAADEYEYGCINKPAVGALCFGSTSADPYTDYSDVMQKMYWIATADVPTAEGTSTSVNFLTKATAVTSGVVAQAETTTAAAGFVMMKYQPEQADTYTNDYRFSPEDTDVTSYGMLFEGANYVNSAPAALAITGAASLSAAAATLAAAAALSF